MKRIASLAALALLASLPAFAQKMDNADAAAMKQLAQSSLNEIEAGKVAASKAQGEDVRRFAQKLTDDHTQMLQELQSLAKARGVVLPENASVRHMAAMKKLEHASGADFDRNFMQEMVKDHQKDAQETESLAAKAKDAQFKAAVQQANAKIRQHLELAQQIAGRTAASGASR